MTSKEALEEWYGTISINDKIRWVDNYLSIKKDLEILEILKKHSTRLDDEDWNNNVFNGIDYENLDEEERKIVKEWLEK